MKIAGLLAAAALMAMDPFHVGDTANRAQPQGRDAAQLQSLARTANEPPVTPVVPGSTAPDFSYQTPDDGWHRLRDLLAQGPVLLVVAPRDTQLTALENERGRLLDLGVIPVAVIDGPVRAARAIAVRLELNYTLVADPQSVIAGQFNAITPPTGAPQPCWFVIDRQRRVRALDRTGLPNSGYVSIARDALALPREGVALPTSR